MATPHPWLPPLWRRLAVTGFCAAWAAIEILFGEAPWNWVALGATGYAIWSFFLSGDYRPS